jgi:hypothetical protein
MTELALNLAWAIIAVTSYALLFCRLANHETRGVRGVNRVQCFAALTCFLAILFPVISLTDDLHEMQATAEEASLSGAVIKRCATGLSSTPAQTSHSIVFIFTPYQTKVRWVVFGITGDLQLRPATPAMHPSAPGRAPPLFVALQFS